MSHVSVYIRHLPECRYHFVIYMGCHNTVFVIIPSINIQQTNYKTYPWKLQKIIKKKELVHKNGQLNKKIGCDCGTVKPFHRKYATVRIAAH